RRPVHDRAGTRARVAAREGGGDPQPRHRQLPRWRDPGAERPLRTLHHRRREERAHSERPRAEDADRSRVRRTARRRAGAAEARPLRQALEERRAQGGSAAGAGEENRREKGRDKEGDGQEIRKKGRAEETGAAGLTKNFWMR